LWHKLDHSPRLAPTSNKIAFERLIANFTAAISASIAQPVPAPLPSKILKYASNKFVKFAVTELATIKLRGGANNFPTLLNRLGLAYFHNYKFLQNYHKINIAFNVYQCQIKSICRGGKTLSLLISKGFYTVTHPTHVPVA
jgi:hypothetical protein